MIFEDSSAKGISGPNVSDSPNWSLTANSQSLQAAALKASKSAKTSINIFYRRMWRRIPVLFILGF